MKILSKPIPLPRDVSRSDRIYHYGSYNTIHQMAVIIDSKRLECHDLSTLGDVWCSVQWMLQFATPIRAIAESFNFAKLIKHLALISYSYYTSDITVCLCIILHVLHSILR